MRLSQRELADKIETTQATLQRYESGIHQPNIETMIKLADFFQISIDDLVGRESDTINLNFYNDNKKSLLGYLAKEDDKTIERVFDFYKGLKYDMLNEAMGYQRPKMFDFPNNTILPYDNQILRPWEQSQFLSNLKDDPFFKDKLKDENK